MSMVDELKAVLTEQEVDAYGARAKRLLRDHGESLVEAVADMERFRWLIEDSEDKSTRDAKNKLLDRMRVMSYFDAISAIDLARTKAGAGGGA